jgi:AcrR family transcriptional regulator
MAKSPQRLAANPTMPASPVPVSSEVQLRILRQSREHFLTVGYSAFNMGVLAAELGMSKKTLYVYFSSKDALIRAVIDDFSAEIRADADAIIGNRQLIFAEKLRGFAQGMIERLARLGPIVLRDLQRSAPALFQHVVEMRAQNIPYVFGRLVEEGQLSGAVRDDINPVFAGLFCLHAIQGIMQPDSLRQLKAGPDAAFDQAIRIFFGGLLTPKGQKDHEKLFARRTES